jgi:hypothetical protein
VHALALANLRPVDEHLGHRVEAVAREVDPLVLQQLGRRVEGAAVLPVGQPDPLHVALVEADVRVFDQPGRHERGVGRAGDAGGHQRVANARRHGAEVTDGAQRPRSTLERDLQHGQAIFA